MAQGLPIQVFLLLLLSVSAVLSRQGDERIERGGKHVADDCLQGQQVQDLDAHDLALLFHCFSISGVTISDVVRSEVESSGLHGRELAEMSEEELADILQLSVAHARSLHHLFSTPWESENRALHANNVQSVEEHHGDHHPPMTIRPGKLLYKFSLDGVLRTIELPIWISGGVVGFDYIVSVAWTSDSDSRTWESLVQPKAHHMEDGHQTSLRVQPVFISPVESSIHRFSVQVRDNFEFVPEDQRVVAACTITMDSASAVITYTHERRDSEAASTQLDRSADLEMRAVNFADQSRLYSHDPVFLRMPLVPLRVDPAVITEHTGLKVRAEYDCANAFRRHHSEHELESDPIWKSAQLVEVLGLNYSASKPSAGEKTEGGGGEAKRRISGEEEMPGLKGDYYNTVPSRWNACNQLLANILSGNTWFLPSYPGLSPSLPLTFILV
jgi:hypothetical protein